ncbi:hypothetical protein LRS06_25010 [Hymenobacter sp. J193]|uniref:hypothetical protein n=1 Tax=Hymenobacter sp. J193 TaxID=2898429 RepID=UPI0021515768|nr:hypothetical protein [Hymenobacter sp. J193]MCR5890902.1 hypothetical protein [Hymenobacter sp. J193]MCR5890987.1 hypothetical protein [Hymenobacter sp. J193]
MHISVNFRLWAGLLPGLLLLNSCTQDPFEGVESNERAITNFTLDKGQIGVAEITRTPTEGTVTVYVVKGTDLSSVVPRIETSYKAKVDPASGVATNFAASNGIRTYSVTSETGQAREWKVQIKEYESDMDGTWKVTNLQFQYFIGEGESWGWSGTKKVADNIADASKENDNTIEFKVTGVQPDGKLEGTYDHKAGPDNAYADFNFKGTDYSYKFRRLPKGQGTWVRDFTDNTITFNPGQAGQTKTATLEFSFDKSVMKMPFNVQPYDIDWNGEGNKMELGGAKTTWYTLQKI